MTTPSTEPGEEPQRLLAQLKSQVSGAFHSNFERTFIVIVLFTILFIFYFCDHKLSLLGLFFLPIILCGYYLNARSTVLGGLLAILVVSFFFLIHPTSFTYEAPNRAPYIYMLLWGSCLILSGALVGTMNEQLRKRFRNASQTLERLNEIQDQLHERQYQLERTNQKLETDKNRLESILHYTMDPTVAQLIIHHKLENEKKEITVLFSDLENFTANVEGIPPEFIIHNLNRLFSDLEPILSRFRGHLDKYIGDGFMAEFGMPYQAKRHPLLAVSAALRIQEHMRKNSPWKMRIGIANGPSLVGLVGSDNRKNYTAIGDIVNLSDRLQRLCPPGSVCVDRNTYEQVARWCRARPLRKPFSKEDRELFDRAQSRLDPERREAVEEAMVKSFLREEEAGYVAIKGKQNQVAIYELLGFIDPFDNYWRVPREASERYNHLRKDTAIHLPDENLFTLEALEGTIGHSKAVAALSVAVAERMGLDEETQKNILVAAHLHDIGKFSIPEGLLNDPRRMADLPSQDQELLRNHVILADKTLKDMGISLYPALLEAISQHHERFDGSGYPDGLKGEQISLIARIIQLADKFESLTAWRPYRDKMDISAALVEMKQEVVDGKFDPKIGQVFLKLLDSSITTS